MLKSWQEVHVFVCVLVTNVLYVWLTAEAVSAIVLGADPYFL